MIQTKIGSLSGWSRLPPLMTSSIQRRASNGVAAAATPVPGLSPEEWDVLRNSVCKGFSDTEAKVFGFRCQINGPLD